MKKFNENNDNVDKKYMDKCVTIIEDILLRFEDSGEILSSNITPRIHSDYDVNKITIVTKFPPEVIGIKKVRVVDKIIDRLRVSFKYVNILYNECICVWLGEDKHFKDVSNIENYVNTILSFNFVGLRAEDDGKHIRFYNNEGVKKAVYTKSVKNLFVSSEVSSISNDTLLQFENGEIANVTKDFMINEYPEFFKNKYQIRNAYIGCENV